MSIGLDSLLREKQGDSKGNPAPTPACVCTGGARGLSDEDLGDSYQSLVDPRLNYEQSLEMAMLVAEKLGG